MPVLLYAQKEIRSINAPFSNYETFTDDRDKQTYKIITLTGTVGLDVSIQQTWMAQNLNYQLGKRPSCYNNKSENCEKYGQLYTWEEAKSVCPKGWHLPSDIEWQRLIHLFTKGGLTYGEGDKEAYQQLLEGGESGFAALLGGFRYGRGEFFRLSISGSYWPAAERDADNAWFYSFSSDSKVSRNNSLKERAFSVRCLKD